MSHRDASGLCECGCDRATSIAKRNDARIGAIRGMPYRFVRGHQSRDNARHLPDPRKMAAADERPVPGFPGYLASPRGDIRGRRGWILRGFPIKGGYLRVHARDVDGRVRQLLVHRAVAAAFIGPCPKGYEVNHKNGITSDNVLANLEYATPSENVRHSLDVLGRQRARGEANGYSKLTAPEVVAMRAAYREGFTTTHLAANFHIDVTHVWRIVTRRAWRHVA